MSSIELKIGGMTCPRCERKIESAVAVVGGWGRASYRTGSVNIIYDDTCVTVQRIRTAIEANGFVLRTE